MKNSVLYLLLLLSLGLNAQCPSGEIVLSSQTDVDNFVFDYPDCTELLGNLVVEGAGIDNLKGLGGIISIAGSLRIKDTQLSDLLGLDILNSVGGELQIDNNDQLLDLNGLFALTTVQRFLVLSNDSLQTLDGLDSLVTIETFESIFIFDNSALFSINGLENVVNCPDCWIDISFNDNLTNLEGLQQIPWEDMDHLRLENNPNLVSCNLDNICQFLAAGGEHLIQGNASGCASGTAILNNCILGISVNNQMIEVKLLPNPVSRVLNVITSEDLDILSISVYSSEGRQVFTGKEGKLEVENFPAGIYFVELRTDGGKLTRKIVKD